ncbi:MAG: simple sugar transport system substrate-binding protein, partial [Halanaerobium sp. T82-1]
MFNLYSRKNNANKVLIFAILLMIIIIFPAAAEAEISSKNTADSDKMTIAFVPRSLENPIFLDAFEHSQKKAVDLGVNLEWLGSFSFDSEEQIKIIDSLIERKVDGMIIS